MAEPAGPTETVTIHLDRSPSEVFAPLADLGRTLERDLDVDEVERVGDPPSDRGIPAVATRFVATNRVDARPERLEVTLVEVDPPRRLVFDAVSRGARIREHLELTATDEGGCDVTVATENQSLPQGTGVGQEVDADAETGGPPPAGSADRPAFVRIGELAARNALRDDPDPR